jgi:outer membrane protein assembly factor BamB
MRRILVLGLLLAWPQVSRLMADDSWPQFRGQQARGVVEGKGLPDTWSPTRNVVWKRDIPGNGWSSPIVWENRIFVTSVLREGKGELPIKGLYFGGDRLTPPQDVHRWMVYCIDWSTGKTLWERQAHRGVPETSHHVKNTYASETPVTDGERVFAYFGNTGLFCYDMAGKELWSRRFEASPTLFSWGTAASPVLHKDRIYVLNDNEKQSYLVALDKLTGKELWRVDRDEKSNWATPFVWENEKRTEIIACGKKRVRSYDLDGKLLWELEGMSSIVIPTPVATSGLLYVSSGYVMDATRPIFAIRPGASGNITLKDRETSSSFVAWYHKQAGPYNPSPLLYGDYLYVLYDRGLLSCYDARTGKEIYTKERIDPRANAFTASPWAYEDKIFCLSEEGDTFVIKAGPRYELLGKNSLEEMCMATPAIARRSLIIRTLSKLYRIQEGTAGKEGP